jgi:hypothetical protein
MKPLTAEVEPADHLYCSINHCRVNTAWGRVHRRRVGFPGDSGTESRLGHTLVLYGTHLHPAAGSAGPARVSSQACVWSCDSSSTLSVTHGNLPRVATPCTEHITALMKWNPSPNWAVILVRLSLEEVWVNVSARGCVSDRCSSEHQVSWGSWSSTDSDSIRLGGAWSLHFSKLLVIPVLLV